MTSFHVILLPADPSRWKAAQFNVFGTPSPDGILALGARLPGEYFVAALATTDYYLLFQEPSRVDSIASIVDRIAFAEADRRTLELRVRKLPPARR